MSAYKEYTVRVYDYRTEWRNSSGELHREDGPAIEYADGSKVWFFNGKRHREDGPAVERANGDKAWYLNGDKLTEDEFNSRTQSCSGRVVEIYGLKYKLELIR